MQANTLKKIHITNDTYGDDESDYIKTDAIDWSDIEKMTSELCEEMGIEMIEADCAVINDTPVTSDLFRIIFKGKD